MPAPAGRCVLDKTVNAITAGSAIIPGGVQNFEVGPIEVYDTNGLLFMKQGFFLP